MYPRTCTQENNLWVCKWGPFSFSDEVDPKQASNLPIALTSPSQDNSGNFLQIGDSSFFYDEEAPVYEPGNRPMHR